MTDTVTITQNAVRRVSKSTKFLLATATVLMIALGSIFALLVLNQNMLREGIREDLLWACYQLDRETRTLLNLIDHQELAYVREKPTLEEIAKRYDILFSRVGTLDGTKYGSLFDNDQGFLNKS